MKNSKQYVSKQLIKASLKCGQNVGPSAETREGYFMLEQVRWIVIHHIL